MNYINKINPIPYADNADTRLYPYIGDYNGPLLQIARNSEVMESEFAESYYATACMAERVLGLKGVRYISMGEQGMTITITPTISWEAINRDLREIFRDYDYGILSEDNPSQYRIPQRIRIRETKSTLAIDVALELCKYEFQVCNKETWKNLYGIKHRLDRNGYKLMEEMFKLPISQISLYPYALYAEKDNNSFDTTHIEIIEQILTEILQTK